MEVQRNVKVHRSGDSEGSWSSGSLSTTRVPKFSNRELQSIEPFRKSVAGLIKSVRKNAAGSTAPRRRKHTPPKK